MDRILVVDDDKSILKVIKMRLEAEDRYLVKTSTCGKEALRALSKERFDLALLDLKLAGEDGIDLMGDLHRIAPELPVLILTAYGTINSAVEAMKHGAVSYITKPFEYPDLLQQIENCLERGRLSKEILRLRSLLKERYGFENIIAKSDKMRRVLDLVAQAAQSDANVYIEGESGTGKELIANTLHLASARKDGPFVAINCAAIPESLLENELFGHEKGAFTGATNGKRGLFSQAHTGSFFMDEISEMPLTMQVKLLRVLQEREVYPLGGGKKIKVDTRLITCSNKDLEDLVSRGLFREDLFYRIHVIPILLPPLRERREDIPVLAEYFLKKVSKKSRKKIAGLTPEALQKLIGYTWPGNVRELENTIEFAVAMCTTDLITGGLILRGQNFKRTGMKGLKEAKETFEKDYLLELIEFTQGNVSKASKFAGKYRADLYELLKKHGINPAEYRNGNGGRRVRMD